nr:2-dehydro-3-deoxygalactonokinase [Caulobacter sp. S45]
MDWGTTNLRAWVVGADGRPTAHQEFALGVSRLGPGEAAVRFRDEVRPALGAEGLPTLITGMAGSNIGWLEVPYADCPADARALARGVVAVPGEAPFVGITPGLRGPGVYGPDVMRGEETQLIGWLAQDPARRQGAQVICHPGTHAKWVLAVDGRIERFVTAMTGELFALLTQHSVLKGGEGDADGPAFDDGLKAAGDGAALAARLFTARSRVVGGGGLVAADVRAYLSGLLIGADVASSPPLLDAPADATVSIVGDSKLCAQYQRALAHRGIEARVHDGEGAVLSGLVALFHAVMRQEPHR